MKSKYIYFLSIFVIGGISFLFAQSALAVCPLCTIAVGAGIGFSRWIGIDDTITGLWIGGFILSMIYWTKDFFNQKEIYFKFRNILIGFLYYFLIIVSLYELHVIGNPSNILYAFAIDKLVFGIIVGSIVFWFSYNFYFYLKEINEGKAYFPFQKVVMPIFFLLSLSFIFYFLMK